MPERITDDCGIPHIASDAVPTATLYDMFITIITQATNLQILMGDPAFLPHYKALQTMHEDMVWLIGILQLAYGISPQEVIDYSNSRKEQGAFSVTSPEEIEIEKIKIEKEAKDHHEVMFR